MTLVLDMDETLLHSERNNVASEGKEGLVKSKLITVYNSVGGLHTVDCTIEGMKCEKSAMAECVCRLQD